MTVYLKVLLPEANFKISNILFFIRKQKTPDLKVKNIRILY